MNLRRVTLLRRDVIVTPRNSALILHQMRDYANVSERLITQRIVIYAAALILAAFYHSLTVATISFILIVMSEVYDNFVTRKIRRLAGYDRIGISRYLGYLHIGALFNASVIAFYTISIVLKQGPTTHFMPLFFLFAASLFAAMNSHQLISVLAIRLSVYGTAFMAIPIWDIYITAAPLTSPLWAQFFTSMFVLYFIVDSARAYLRLYQKNMRQIVLLRRENERNKAISETKSQFLATVSHELRTPLTSIKGSLDLAISGALGEIPERFSRVLEIAQRNAGRLNVLIDDLLDERSMESGTMRYNFKPVQLSNFIPNVVSTNQPLAEQFQITLADSAVDDDVFVTADPERLEQVLSNILSNAIEFSNSGGEVVVSVGSTPDRVRINVTDSGVGLSELDRDKVFAQFSQIDSSDQRKVGGTGLGMHISKSIIEAHGGRIDYFANDKKGTTFYVDLERLTPANKVQDRSAIAI